MTARKPSATPPSASPHRAPAKPAAAAPRAVKAPPAKPTKPAKAAKLQGKAVRDSFTMPAADFAVIATLKSRALAAGRAAKKSELLRAGLRVLDKLNAKALIAALNVLAPVKTGRPSKSR